MACEVFIHDEAKQAFFQAIDYLLLVSDGPGAAIRLADEFERRVAQIADNPDLFGLSRDPGLARAGYHAVFVTSYVLLYYVSKNEVHIAFFFHQSQDYTRYVIRPESKS